MNLLVNALPTRTWNRLNMNETKVTVDAVPENHIPQARRDAQEVSWTPAAPAPALQNLAGDALTALTAKAQTGLVETAENQTMTQPIRLHYQYHTGENGASRLVLHACANSRLRALLLLTDEDVTADGLTVLQTEVLARENAVIDLYMVQLLGSGRTCIQDITGVCDANAQVHLTKLELGGGKVYTNTNIDLRGRESQFTAELGYHVLTGQTLDMNYVATHHGAQTVSNMSVCGTLEEDARKLFRGTIDFQRGCKGAKGDEVENVLLMGDNMVNQTIPLILCKEEDVEGNHGASIGRLDEKVLFYLSTRGISQEMAAQMIAAARIEAICGKMPDEAVSDLVHEFEEKRGAGHEPSL